LRRRQSGEATQRTGATKAGPTFLSLFVHSFPANDPALFQVSHWPPAALFIRLAAFSWWSGGNNRVPREPEQLDSFRRWFDIYTSRFFGEDEYINMHLRLKREHTRRTCEEIVFLAGQLALDEQQKRTAETVALFHDVGRFPQFAEYRTYNDARSVDHSRLSVAVLREEGVLGVLRREERQWIETAIEHHGRKSLPGGLTGQALLFAKLIRDADKLDILRIVVQVYQHRRDHPDGLSFESELPDEPRFSPEVLEAVLHGQLVEYTRLRTLNDMVLCQLGWVYDMNFAATLARLHERGLLQQLLGLLPAAPDIDRLRDKLLTYIDTRIHEGVR
jgi:hypothetical protein